MRLTQNFNLEFLGNTFAQLNKNFVANNRLPIAKTSFEGNDQTVKLLFAKPLLYSVSCRGISFRGNVSKDRETRSNRS